MDELPYTVAQLRGGASTGQLRHAVHPAEKPGIEFSMCGRPARHVKGTWSDTPSIHRCTRCTKAVAANEAKRRTELDEALDGLYLVFFGTRMEVALGPPLINKVEGLTDYTEEDAVGAVVEDWINERYPVLEPGSTLHARFAPPVPAEVGCRPLKSVDMELFATWDSAFANKVKRLMKKGRKP